jgi:acetone carboxylase, alpha subunit
MTSKHGIGENGKTLLQMLEETDRASMETGCYAGLEDLRLKQEDPIKFELLHSRLLASLISGMQATKMIAASPIVREVQELCVALYTPEGHCIAASTGIQVHILPMGEAVRWAIRNNYEEDPGIHDGDLFSNNDCTIAGMHPADVYDISPIFHGSELIGWVSTVIMEMDIGAAGAGPMPAAYNVEKFTDGFFLCMEKTGTSDTLRRDYLARAERTLRFPHMFILHRKGALAANVRVREDIRRLVDEFGIAYYKGATKELIEDSRRIQLHRVRQRTVPGRLRNPHYLELYFKDKPVPAYAKKDSIRLVPFDIHIRPSGEIIVDFEGAGDWGWHSLNATPSALYGGLAITLVSTLAYDGKANHGTLMGSEIKAPAGSVVNPASTYVPTANIWGCVLPIYANFLECLSRTYYSRGFREEILLGPNTPGVVMAGYTPLGHVRRQMLGEFAIGGDHRFMGQQSGARGIADGIEHAMYNPETDMGNTEVMELVNTGMFLGTRIMPDSGGFGRYRGGLNLCTTQVLRGVEWIIAETMPFSTTHRILNNRGIFGGYPGNLFYAYVTRNGNVKELIDKQLPLPKAEGDPRDPDIIKLVKGDITRAKMWWYSEEVLRDYDLIQICYNNNNGGYGDPIERDTGLIQSDLELGFTSPETARSIYCAEPIHNGASDEWAIDEESTTQLRNERRKERLQKGIPFKEWWERSRKKVMKQEMPPLLAEMYQNSMKNSSRFADEYRSFWGLPDDFAFGGE